MYPDECKLSHKMSITGLVGPVSDLSINAAQTSGGWKQIFRPNADAVVGAKAVTALLN